MPTYDYTYRRFNVYYILNISHEQTRPNEAITTSDDKWAFFVETDEECHMGSIYQITASLFLGIYNYRGPQRDQSLDDESIQRKRKLGELRESDLERFEKVVDRTPLHHYLLEQERVWIMEVSRELRKYGLLLEYTFLDADWDWSKVQSGIEEEIYS
jgi:hypothetical protein